MELTDTLGLAHRFLSTLSGGERQRVYIARLSPGTTAFGIDEPTSQLDITYQAETLGFCNAYASKKKLTAIAAIHDLNLAVQYFQRFILLSQGRILSQGTAEEVITCHNLRCAYQGQGVDITVSCHPVHQRPLVTVFPKTNGRLPAAQGADKEAMP